MLHKNLDGLVDELRASKPKRLSTARGTARLECMSGAHQLMAKLLYSSGLRLMKCVRLRIKDVDFDWPNELIREKGLK